MDFTFEWDPAKAQANIVKHGIRFEVATAAFLDPMRLDGDVSRAGDGEERRKVIAAIQGRVVSVLYTLRAGRRRLISARLASAAERRSYERGALQA